MAEAHTQGQERRERDRFDIRYSVTIRSPRGLVDRETKNMSGTGALTSCEQPLFLGETCDLILWPPFDSPIETAAKVVWSRLHDVTGKIGVCEAGVHFLQRRGSRGSREIPPFPSSSPPVACRGLSVSSRHTGVIPPFDRS